jgi:hypothetical protein
MEVRKESRRMQKGSDKTVPSDNPTGFRRNPTDHRNSPPQKPHQLKVNQAKRGELPPIHHSAFNLLPFQKQSARLAESKTLRAFLKLRNNAPASWTAVALYRFPNRSLPLQNQNVSKPLYLRASAPDRGCAESQPQHMN